MESVMDTIKTKKLINVPKNGVYKGRLARLS